eukprot:CAMPEP_0172751220 /NCGR_PEP_ID=MMETSP1074-20121228/151180_1 /TAXON_ID=2916 /ORGANISM="Ceratium fusus, Strain PA161109" /LENGTH=74 /DNA_ID=CAMNT_0013583491 /DNA_START=20 /DNA_END=241 /DNA_ORIENTATION=-
MWVLHLHIVEAIRPLSQCLPWARKNTRSAGRAGSPWIWSRSVGGGGASMWDTVDGVGHQVHEGCVMQLGTDTCS